MRAMAPFFLICLTGTTFANPGFGDEPGAPPPLTEEERRDLIERAGELEQTAAEQHRARQFTELRGSLEEMLTIARRLFPEDQFPKGHPALAATLDRLGTVYADLGLCERAVEFSRRGLEMRQTLLPEGHIDLGHGYHNFASVLLDDGDPVQALAYARKALGIYRDHFPADRHPDGHPALMNNLSVISRCYAKLGDWGRARTILRQAVTMAGELLPEGDIQFTDAEHDRGVLLLESGEPNLAITVLKKTLERYREHYPRDRHPKGHPRLMTNLAQLSYAARLVGDDDQALAYLREGAEIAEAYFPEGSVHRIDARHSLGVHYLAAGQYRMALEALRPTLSEYRERFPGGHWKTLNNVTDIAYASAALGDREEALRLYRQALALCRQLYPRDAHPDGHWQMALILPHVARSLHVSGESAEALELVREGLAMNRRLIDQFTDQSAEAEALNFVVGFPFTRDLHLTITGHLEVSGGDSYRPLWSAKSAVMQVMARRQAVLPAAARDKPEVRELWDELTATRRRLSRLLRADARGDDHQHRLTELSSRKEGLERQLAAVLPRGGVGESEPIDPEDLRQALPPGAAFIDLHRYFRVGDAGTVPAPRYVGFVVSKGGPITRVELGLAGPIDRAVEQWRDELRKGEAGGTASEVRRLVWEPLASHLPPDLTAVWLAPDGSLTRLPWAALPGGEAGTILLEESAVAVVPHGPFLLERLTAPKSGGPEPRLLATGGIDYAGKPSAAEAGPVTAVRSAAAGPEVTWPDLPATAEEAAKIAGLAGERPVIRLTGSEATTARLLSELPRARFAHLATHGFFADERFRSALRVDEELFRTSIGGERAAPGTRNPLVLSGLVLAGANRPRPTDLEAILTHDDGILTAEAVAGLDLSGLELAVLSACETGLGEVAGGEGVYGLQRAFHVAGCDNVVASLWKVDDEATAALMAKFYHELWVNKKPPIEALRQAQLTVYRQPDLIPALARSRGFEFGEAVKQPAEKPTGSRKTAHPRLWAAFVLSGAGR